MDDQPVSVFNPAPIDLIPNERPTSKHIRVPRPALGDLMKECNDATTLYGRTLRVEAREVGKESKRPKTLRWTEEIDDRSTDYARHEVQQRYWRYGRGEEKPADEPYWTIREHGPRDD